jgi:hypothetical protein
MSSLMRVYDNTNVLVWRLGELIVFRVTFNELFYLNFII